MRRIILRVDAVFLALAGLFGFVSDLLSYASGAGPFGDTFHGNPTVIGVVEAHALALLIAATIWYFARAQSSAPGHWLGFFAHAVMGLSNIIWFDVFVRVQAETQGVAVTVVHVAFVGLNAFVLATSRRSDRRGSLEGAG